MILRPRMYMLLACVCLCIAILSIAMQAPSWATATFIVGEAALMCMALGASKFYRGG